MIDKSKLGKYKDPDVRAVLASELKRDIDAYHANRQSAQQGEDSPSLEARWTRTKETYYGRKVYNSLQFLPGYEPYMVPLMQPRVDTIVSGICDVLTENNPYFIVKSNENDQVAACIEHDLTYALSQAHFDAHIRKITQECALKGRGPFRVRYETVNRAVPGEEYDGLEEDSGANADVIYSGLRIDPIEAEDFVIYPFHCEQINRAKIVGHCTRASHEYLLARQAMGIYFPEDELVISSNIDRTRSDATVGDPEDLPMAVYDLLYREIEGDEEKWWRVSFNYEGMQILHMEPYELKEPWYFAPYFRGDISTFWPYQSIGDRLFDLQVLYNDAHTALILGTMASSMPSTGVSGYQGTESTISAGINQFVVFKGTPNFFPIPSTFNPQGLIWQIGNIERIADGVARTAQMGMGQQLRSDVTATEVQSIAMGQAAGSKAYTLAFSMELERMANFAAELLAANFEEFQAFNQGNIRCMSAEEFQSRVQIESNGKSNSDIPEVMMQKLSALKGGLTQLGVAPTPATKMLNTDALAQLTVDSLNLPTSPSKILIDMNQGGKNEQLPFDPTNGGQMEMPQGIPGGDPSGMPAGIGDILNSMGANPIPERQGGMLEVPVQPGL